MPGSVSSPPVGGRLQFFAPAWHQLTRDAWILQTVSGLILDMETTPIQVGEPRELQFSTAKAQAVDREIQELLQKDAILPVRPVRDQFVSRLFTVPKRDCPEERPVIDLRDLNQFLVYEHFQMEGIHLVPELLQQGDWLAKLDLKDAYFTVPVCADHRKYLRFRWRAQLYEFQCLPFGLASAPRVFSKVMRVPIGQLRRQGIRLIVYLDDLLIMANSRDLAVQHVTTTTKLLQSLGFVINWRKSVPIPAQEMVFLGFLLDSTSMEMRVPATKIQKLRRECRTHLQSSRVSVRVLSSLIGKMVACAPGMMLAPLQYRHLQQLKIQSLRQWASYNRIVNLTPEARNEILWWATHLDSWNGRSLMVPPARLTIFSDASSTGWGAVCNRTPIGGVWSTSERLLHINVLELLAAQFAVRSFHRQVQTRPLLIRLLIDNTTTVSYINRMGGTHSQLLSDIACSLWRWCTEKQITLQAEYLPSAENPADGPSRGAIMDSSDWQLDPAVFSALCQQLPWQPSIDLFASRLNAQLPRFFSWHPDPDALSVDALAQDWTVSGSQAAYAFPPFCLLGKCLQKARSNPRCNLILIAPVWETQSWYSTILQLLVDFPVLLPNNPDLLLSPHQEPHPMLLAGHLHLAAWPISSNVTLRRAFLRRLWTSSQARGGRLPTPRMPQRGANGSAGVIDELSIPFTLL